MSDNNNDNNKPTKIEEGILKKGGLNDAPEVPRPTSPPPPFAVQKPNPQRSSTPKTVNQNPPQPSKRPQPSPPPRPSQPEQNA